MKPWHGILIGAVIAGIVGLLIWGLVSMIQSDTATCANWKQTVTSISHNDPQDLPNVLDMYSEDCGN